MVLVEVKSQDVKDATSQGRRNMAGTLFGSSGPLFRPFLNKLDELLPPDKRGRSINYTSSTLKAHVDAIKVDEEKLCVKSENRAVEITKNELEDVLSEKYPTLDHKSLSLPGLLFLQSGPVLQLCTLNRLRSDHGVQIPGGNRTHRYFFHTTVVSIQANEDLIEIEFDLDRLPNLSGGSTSTETLDSV